MEEIKSLGFVQLFKSGNYNNHVITTETCELFIERVLGKIIFKIKYEDVYYALPVIENNEWVRFYMHSCSRYFRSEILKYYIDLYGDNNEKK